ncbi:MAG: 5-carboxymethyl-2-hydroxymuconateDelta-isomerase [Conexibacter sp.]|nr:5-carboxymethyl-2-hydroxymuconateDelta-isomerase [Conexibacter sp.]
MTRLVTYEDGDGWRAGLAVDDSVVDLEQAAAAEGLDHGAGWGTVRQVLAQPEDALQRVLDAARRRQGALGRARADVTIGPPVPDPDKILCIGVNYADHQKEGKDIAQAAHELPRYPIVFNKFTAALIADNQAVDPPAATKQLDYEAELAVVIGRRARNVPLADALEHVAGYACFNDISARDLQLRTPQWAMGKGFDTSGPFGPELVLRDEVPDPQALMLRGLLNGEVVQESSTAAMIFSVAQIIEFISSAITLLPGDVIATGTPAGVGVARQPPRLLGAGDVFTVEIDGVGRLTTPINAPSSSFVSCLEDVPSPAS